MLFIFVLEIHVLVQQHRKLLDTYIRTYVILQKCFKKYILLRKYITKV